MFKCADRAPDAGQSRQLIFPARGQQRMPDMNGEASAPTHDLASAILNNSIYPASANAGYSGQA